MIRQTSRRHAESHLTDDWPVYIAFLPAIITSAAIAVTAAIALGTASSWHQSPPQAGDLKATPAADDYVEGLARLGIATLPSYEPPAVMRSGSGGGALPLSQLTRGCVLLG